MKRCSKCKQDKPKVDFNKNRSRSDGLQSFCRDCEKIRKKTYYSANKKQFVKYRNKYQAELKEWWDDIRKDVSCERCGDTRHYVIEWHHRDPSQKDFVLANALKIGSRKRILAEMTKCSPLCRNCHAEVHFLAEMEEH